MSVDDELWVYQEYVNGKGWGAIGGYVVGLRTTLVFQNRDRRVVEGMFDELAREHVARTGNRLRLAKFKLESTEELT